MVNLSVQQLRIIVVKKMVNPLWNLEEHVWCGFWAPVLKKGTMTTPKLGMPPAPSGGRDEGKKGRPCAKRRKLKCRFQRIRMPVHTMSLCPRRRRKDLRHWNSWTQSKDFEKERDKNRNLDAIPYNILQSSTFIAKFDVTLSSRSWRMATRAQCGSSNLRSGIGRNIGVDGTTCDDLWQSWKLPTSTGVRLDRQHKKCWKLPGACGQVCFFFFFDLHVLG